MDQDDVRREIRPLTHRGEPPQGGRPPGSPVPNVFLRRVELESKIVLLKGRRLERRERLGGQPGAPRRGRNVTQP